MDAYRYIHYEEFVYLPEMQEKIGTCLPRVALLEVRMFIKCYGLFWLRDEVDWTPGTGGTFQLLGRQGKNFGTVRVADFRQQTGIYILYGYHGACYVGLEKKQHGMAFENPYFGPSCRRMGPI